jgi:endo-1,4-beta-D-glucanase Y
MISRRHMLASMLGLLGTSLVKGQDAPPRTLAQTRWETFKRRFVTPDGRVIDTGNAGISHSEGQGVALLAAATLKDEEAFTRLWTFTQSMRRNDGLFSWKYVPGQGIADINNATDGDLYVTWALARASKMFGKSGYGEEAARTAQAVRKLCLVQDSHGLVLLPAVQGFRYADGKTPLVVNPAYWVFPALTVCASLEADPQWQQCIQTGLDLLRYAHFGRFQLPADWLSLADPVTPWQARPARFGYEAIRIPLFLYWSGQFNHPCLQRFAAFARTPGFPPWIGLDDEAQADYCAPAGFEAVASLARAAVYGLPATVPELDTDYFSSSLVLLAALATTTLKPA